MEDRRSGLKDYSNMIEQNEAQKSAAFGSALGLAKEVRTAVPQGLFSPPQGFRRRGDLKRFSLPILRLCVRQAIAGVLEGKEGFRISLGSLKVSQGSSQYERLGRM
jgi:hypothetical protein